MGCAKRFLFFHWEHHDWVRRVSATENHWSHHSDIWGGTATALHVTCHVQHVCRSCGKTRDGAVCSCDKAKADHCAVRLAFLHGAAAGA